MASKEELQKRVEYAFGPTDEQMSELSTKFLNMAKTLIEDCGDDPAKIKEAAKDIDRIINTARTNAQFDDQRRRLDAKTPTSIVSVSELNKELLDLVGEDEDES